MNKIVIDNNSVKIKESNHVTLTDFPTRITATWQDRKNTNCSIKKISKTQYIYKRTGEVCDFKQSNNRADNKNSVRKSLNRLCDKINYNVVDVSKCLWVTLTYKENMTDTVKLYSDMDKFYKRFRYSFPDNHFEYITAIEPQGRGAWHAHCIFIFDNKAPYIPNQELAKIWGHGFTNTKALKKGDNIGAYLTAYLGDIELEENEPCEYSVQKKGNKRIAKGARLELYPVGMNFYRCSRGIKSPQKVVVTFKELIRIAKEKGAILNNQRTIFLQDLNVGFQKTISYFTFIVPFEKKGCGVI